MINQFNSWYHSAADPAYEAWSDSYLNEWLWTHNVTPYSKDVLPRPTLLERIKLYYYDVTQKVCPLSFLSSTFTNETLHRFGTPGRTPR